MVALLPPLPLLPVEDPDEVLSRFLRLAASLAAMTLALRALSPSAKMSASLLYSSIDSACS